MEKIEFGRVAGDYARYRDELPQVVFEQLRVRGVQFAGTRVMDLGSGSGIWSRSIALQDARVTGVEPEKDLIDQARWKDKELGLSIEYIHSRAEDIPLPDGSFDMATALRAWHWFHRNEVNEQVIRLVKPGGYLIVIHSAFVPSLSEAAQASMEIIRKYIPRMLPAGSFADGGERRNGFPVRWFEEWGHHGFHEVDTWQHDYQLVFTKDEWCGKIRTLSWLTSAGEELKTTIVQEIQEALRYANDPLLIPHMYSVALLRLTEVPSE